MNKLNQDQTSSLVDIVFRAACQSFENPDNYSVHQKLEFDKITEFTGDGRVGYFIYIKRKGVCADNCKKLLKEFETYDEEVGKVLNPDGNFWYAGEGKISGDFIIFEVYRHKK